MRFASIEDVPSFVYLLKELFPHDEFKHFREVSEFHDDGFDAVFCDLRLRETWGVETINALNPKTKSPIIVLTGLGRGFLGATDLAKYLDAGATEVFYKDIVQDPSFPELVRSKIGKR